MKIKHLSVFFYIFCFTLTVLAQSETDVEAGKLRGAVKKIEVYFMVPQTVNGRETLAPQIYESTVFNRQGWMIEQTSFWDGNVQTKSVYLHDRKGRRIFNQYYGSSVFTDQFVYKKDAEGRLAEQQKINPAMKRALTRVTLKYDSKGNVIEENTFYLGSESPDETKVFAYDEKDRQIGQAVYDSKRVLKYKSTHKFDQQDRVSETTYESEGMFEKQTFSYDTKNRLETILMFDLKKNEIIGQKVYRYDDEKLIEVVQELDQNENLLVKTVSRLDRFGNVLRKSQSYTEAFIRKTARAYNKELTSAEITDLMKSSGEKSDETFGYEYDEAGNWIKRFDFGVTKLSGGQINPELKPIRTEIRTISYYE